MAIDDVSRGRGEARGENALAAALRRCRGAFATVGLFSFAINLLMLAGPLYMLQVYDRVLGSGSAETLALLTLMLAATFAAMAALETLRGAVATRIGAWLTRTLGPFYLDAGLRARIDGETAPAQAFRDITQMQTFIASPGMTAFFDAPWTPLFLAMIWLLHPWLGLLATGVALTLLGLSLANEILTKSTLRAANAGQMESHRLAEAALDAAESVHAMGMGPAIAARWSDRNDQTQRALLRASTASGLVTGVGKFTRYIGQSGALGLGAYLVLLDEATPGVMIAASILLGRALAPVDQAMSAWKNFSSARLAHGRLRAIAEVYGAAPRRMSLPPPSGGLQVDKLTAVGPNGPILKMVSFDVAAGEALAVIGPSGAGKSTLCRYLVGLARPRSGTVRLGGVDILHWNPDELGPHVGFLSQDVGLFAGSVRENIARMADAPEDLVVEAAMLAHAHEMIHSLPEGYDTELGPRGAGLSAGQRQRIGLARAVFGAPALVVLDEPNANLDQEGEAALGAAIEALKARGAALVIVGHRPSTLNQSDKVLVLKGGAVQAFGPRAEVLDALRVAKPARIPAQRVETGEPDREGGDDGSESRVDRPSAPAQGADARTAGKAANASRVGAGAGA